MKVNIVRTQGFSEEKLHEVADLLHAFAGPIQFIAKNDPVFVSNKHIVKRDLNQYQFEHQQSLKVDQLVPFKYIDTSSTTSTQQHILPRLNQNTGLPNQQQVTRSIDESITDRDQ